MLVHPVTNVPGRFVVGMVVRLDDGRELTIRSVRAHQQRMLVRFEGVDDRNGAEALRGRSLRAEALDAAPEGEVWVHELVGARVHTLDGADLGLVRAVVANPAHDLLELDGGLLVPMVFVREIEPGPDRGTGLIRVDLPEGLVESQRKEG